MRHLKFHKDSAITLEATTASGTTPAKAIQEAIDFVQLQGLEAVDLKYHGFTMLIEPTTSLRRLVTEYMEWERLYAEKVKNSMMQQSY